MENSEIISKAIEYIKNECQSSDITLDDVAKSAGFSVNYFNYIFLSHTGFNVMEYVRFCRMRKASYLLRMTEKDILDIALDCGYDTHASFTRAFGNHFGVSPTEYRKNMAAKEAFYGDFHNETLAQRIIHEFPGFRQADSDEAIDFILDSDDLKYGSSAVDCRVNGSVALYNGNDLKDGFVHFTELPHTIMGEIISDDYKKIAEYLKIFSDDRFFMEFYTTDCDATVTDELKKYGVKVTGIDRWSNCFYFGEPYEIIPPSGYSVRELRFDDMEILRQIVSKVYADRTEHELYQRDVLGNGEHSVLVYGIFYNGKPVGTSWGGLQSAHGFRINNGISTSIEKEHQSEELYRYVFKYVTNDVMKKGALPFDDIQCPGKGIGEFESTEFGYVTKTYACAVRYVVE